MAFVSVPKDLTKVKNKVVLKLTKRQLICLSAAAAFGLPFYLLSSLPHSRYCPQLSDGQHDPDGICPVFGHPVLRMHFSVAAQTCISLFFLLSSVPFPPSPPVFLLLSSFFSHNGPACGTSSFAAYLLRFLLFFPR